MKKAFLVLLALMIGSIAIYAQLVEPVQWSFSTKKISDTQYDLIIQAQIEPGWHVYGVKLPEGGPLPVEIAFEESNLFTPIDSLREEPAAKVTFDDMFEMEVGLHDGQAKFIHRVEIKGNETVLIKGELSGQACDDKQCTLIGTDFEFRLNPKAIESQGKDSPGVAGEKIDRDTGTNQAFDPRAPIDLTSRSLWSLFFIAFLAGLIALLTPCVFPMIPMTVSFFMHGSKSKRRSLFSALFFGFSIIAIYTVIGTLVAILFGPGIANFLSTHWIPNVLFFLIFIFFAAWFFGMFEITLPSWMISKTDQQVDKGGFGGPFFMAFTLVLVSFSCTGPIVGTILVESAGGALLEPIIGMLGFSLAFALPFTLFAIFPSWLTGLPKSGGWLNSVKVVLGFIELALGLKFLSVADQTYHWGLLDREVYLAIWIVIFTLLGFYLLGKIQFKHDSEVKHLGVFRLFLVIVTFSFVVYLIPGMIGAPLKALAGYLPPITTHDFDLKEVIRQNAGATYHSSPSAETAQTPCEKPRYSDRLKLPHGLIGYFDYEQGLACAKSQNKPVFIDFTGHGCVNCREMEDRVWSDPRVLLRLREEYVIIALYVDDKSIKLEESEWVTSSYDGKVKKTLGKKYQDFQITRFGTNSQPYYCLLDNEGNLLIDPMAYDLDVDKFIEFLDRGIQEFKTKQ